MTLKDVSAMRRIMALEEELAATKLEIDAMRSQRARSWTWPRDMFLGRTWSTSFSNYPTSGDTFQVKLLEGDFAATEGTQAVSETDRGSIVIARTWPAQYLARDTQVIVKRIQGLGAYDRGQYWIEPQGAGGDPHVMFGGTAYWLSSAGRTTALLGPGGNTPVRAFPNLGSGEAAAAYLEGVPNPLNIGERSITVLTAGWYHFFVHTEWILYDLNPTQADYWYYQNWVAPNLVTYPTWMRYGPGSVRVTTTLTPTNHLTAAGNLRAHSTAMARTLGSYVPIFGRHSHIVSSVMNLPAGATVDIGIAANMDMPGHVSLGSTSNWPRAEIAATEVAIHYAGT